MSGEEDAELDERGVNLGDVFANNDTRDEPETADMAEPTEIDQEAEARASPTEVPPETSETTATSETSETSETSAADPTTATSETETSAGAAAPSDTEAAGDPTGTDTGGDGGNPGDGARGQASKIVRESKNLNIYVSEDLYERVQRTYKELDSEYYATHGEDLEKNREFYTALLTAGLESAELRERLGLE